MSNLIEFKKKKKTKQKKKQKSKEKNIVFFSCFLRFKSYKRKIRIKKIKQML